MTTQLITPITDGQRKQYLRFVEDATQKGAKLALEQVPIDKEGFQKLIERGDEFNSAIAALIVAKTRELSVFNEFINEEVESNYGYLSGYTEPKSIAEQVGILREFFPHLGCTAEAMDTMVPIPYNTEGWFAIPRWGKIAPTYREACQKVFEIIKKTRNGKFQNYREGQLDPMHLRQSEKSAKMFQKLADEQNDHDILVIAAQFGLRHRGRSVRRAREVMNALEFGLGTFAVGIMLLTHPDRLQHYDDLWIDCAGDEFSYAAGGRFGLAPCFSFYDGRLRFDAHGVANAYGFYGSASASVPQ